MSRCALAALAAALVLAAPGCGGDEPSDPVGDAASAAVAAGTSRIAYEASFLTPVTSYGFRGEGEADYETGRARIVYDLSEFPDSAAEEVEVRIDGGAVYVRFPAGTPGFELPEGKEWLRADAAQVAEQTGTDVAAVHQDPALFLRYLRDGATEVREEGAEEVRGEQTTIYTAVLDLDRVLERGLEDVEGERGEAARAQLERIRQEVGSTVPVTVNVDPEGRLRRITMTFDLETGGQPSTVLTTTDLYDFGADVDVAPPPDDAVAEAGTPPGG